MKEYSAKSLEEALELASKDSGLPVDQISYDVVNEKIGLFKKLKSITISVFDMFDVVTYVEDYLRKLFAIIGIEVKIKPKLEDDVVCIDLNSPQNNSLIIGRQGNTLEAITALARQSVSQYFKKMVMVRIDVSGYKAKRYNHLIHLAKVWGRNVLRSKETLVLDPLPPDERRVIHQALGDFKNITTKSLGEGRYKRLSIIYTGPVHNRSKADEEQNPNEEVLDTELDTEIIEQE